MTMQEKLGTGSQQVIYAGRAACSLQHVQTRGLASEQQPIGRSRYFVLAPCCLIAARTSKLVSVGQFGEKPKFPGEEGGGTRQTQRTEHSDLWSAFERC